MTKKGATDHEHTMLSLSLTLHDFALGVSSMVACYVQKSAASVIVGSATGFKKVICRDKIYQKSANISNVINSAMDFSFT